MISDGDTSLLTRETLLDRLKNPNDQDAWQDFYGLYKRLILNFALRAGLNDADAQDVLQDTMRDVAKYLPEFDYRPEKARFKTWLLEITRHRLADFFRRMRRQPPAIIPLPSEGDTATGLLERLPDPSGAMAERVWDEEWENNRKILAVERLKPHLKARHYQITYELFVNERAPGDVAKMLGLSAANVYLVKHRVLPRFRTVLHRLKEEL